MKVQRAPGSDFVAREGEAAILVGESLIRLSELSAFVAALCVEPTDVVTLGAALEAEFGTPPDMTAQDATRVAVGEMLSHGVLVSLI